LPTPASATTSAEDTVATSPRITKDAIPERFALTGGPLAPIFGPVGEDIPSFRLTAPREALTPPPNGVQVAGYQEVGRDRVAGGIPSVALDAYQRAAGSAPADCGITWELLAAIGRVESNHGRYGGASLDSDGRMNRPILGLRLNGGTTARITDTDDGQLDGDTQFDRAVGPMQFIPGTWAAYGRDGNADSRRDPQNVYDAAAAAASYLCAAGRDLSDLAGRQRAVFAYNHSSAYVSNVLALAAQYADQNPPALPSIPIEAIEHRPAPATPSTPSGPVVAAPTPPTAAAVRPSPPPPAPDTRPTPAAPPAPSPSVPPASPVPTAPPTSGPPSTPIPTPTPVPTPTPTPSTGSLEPSATPMPTSPATPAPTCTPAPAANLPVAVGLLSATDDDLLLAVLEDRIRAADTEIHDLSDETPVRSGIFYSVGAQLQAAALAGLLGIEPVYVIEAPVSEISIALGPAGAAEMLALLNRTASCP
jgi:hypothetical protein